MKTVSGMGRFPEIISNKNLAKVYVENWFEHKEHSERYDRK